MSKKYEIKQYLVVGKNVLEIENGTSAKWVMKNMRGNGYKVSCIFSLQELIEARENEYEYILKLIKTNQILKAKYIQEGIHYNIRIVNNKIEW